MRSVTDALRQLRGRRALLIGDLVLDAYVYGETVRVSREAPVLVVRKDRVEHRLGGAANTAQNLTALGITCELAGSVGNDEGGKRLRDMLAGSGADVSALVECDVTTAVKTRVLAGAFGTTKQQVLRIDDEPSGELPDAIAARVAEQLRARAEHADVVVVCDYGLGAVPARVIDAVRAIAAQKRTVCVDSRYRLAQFSGVTMVKPNAPEAEAIAGLSPDSAAAAERAGKKILETLAVKMCLLTQGRHGMTLCQAGLPPSHVDIVGEEEVTDVTGAGDTVMAVFAAALAARLGPVNAMRLANVAAGVVVTKVGAATASHDEIAELAARGGVELEPWGA
jgi:D-glycero-beta-D-manno-heptose-7-phosphate kinase